MERRSPTRTRRRSSTPNRDQARDAGKAPDVADRVSRTPTRPRPRASKIAAGTSFEDIAKERGLNAGRHRSRHGRRKPKIIDPAVADAAFALPTGEVSQPVQGRFGVVLVKVGEITPGSTPSYDSVAATIKRDLAPRARARRRSTTCTTRWRTSAAAAPTSSRPPRKSA